MKGAQKLEMVHSTSSNEQLRDRQHQQLNFDNINLMNNCSPRHGSERGNREMPPPEQGLIQKLKTSVAGSPDTGDLRCSIGGKGKRMTADYKLSPDSRVSLDKIGLKKLK